MYRLSRSSVPKSLEYNALCSLILLLVHCTSLPSTSNLSQNWLDGPWRFKSMTKISSGGCNRVAEALSRNPAPVFNVLQFGPTVNAVLSTVSEPQTTLGRVRGFHSHIRDLLVVSQ